MLQEISDPHAILHIRLTAGDLLDVGGVDEQTHAVLLEHVVHGLPVHAGTLHGHVGHPVRFEPVPQGDQMLRGGAERADVLDPVAAGARHADTDRHTIAMDVQACPTLDQPLHGRLPAATSPGSRGSLGGRACSPCSGATMRGAERLLRLIARRTAAYQSYFDVSGSLTPRYASAEFSRMHGCPPGGHDRLRGRSPRSD